jgi:hypothetical protein
MSAPDTPPAVCGWCGGAHSLADCPRAPRLLLEAVVTFALEALVRPGRTW